MFIKNKQGDSYQKQNDQNMYLVNLTMQIGIGVKVTQRLEVFKPSDVKEPRTTKLSPISIMNSDQFELLISFRWSIFVHCKE